MKSIVILLALTVFHSTVACAEETGIEWKTLPEYMAMDGMAQFELIAETRRVVMRKLAHEDLYRAECVSDLYNFDTQAGRKQFYNTKGFLKVAAKKGLDWKAQQLVAHMITKEFCPALPMRR
ncbi:hypothetical protein [Candidatus Thiodiazotropha sp. LNASS1]|uniref:hypothetical protein n=1 Tax=Candidatus Thiodiazotropha sp. LNASS1 TaxID=3096260 RepID=UPI0034DEC375